MNDGQLLNDFVENGSENAFRCLVNRHLPLVVGTARRIAADNALAEEITQTVFILLARKARSLSRNIVLTGWLYRTTCFVAARALRAEYRRRRREQEAFAMQTQHDPGSSSPHLAPHLDEAMQRLNQIDRDAILLRYFEQLPLRDVGVNLGVTEEAAKKRVNRALEKLRRVLSRRGTEIVTATLVAGLSEEAAKAATIAETSASVSKIAAAALAPAAVGSSSLVLEVLSAWRWAKVKLALGIGAGAVVTSLVLSQATSTPGHTSASPTPSTQGQGPTTLTDNGSQPESPPTQNEFSVFQAAGQTFPAHPLKIIVLDAFSGDPIPGAEVAHTLMVTDRDERPVPLRTDTNGAVTILVPKEIPEGDRIHQFEAWIRANNYASRSIMWLSSTGGVLTLVSNEYTVRLESGCTVSGTVTDESGKPLAGVHVESVGNNYRGYSYTTDGSGKIISPPVRRVEDFSSFSADCRTDRDGRFQFTHYPTDLKAVMFDLTGIDGARRKFGTPQGKRLTADEFSEVSFEELLAGTARLVLPRGITVEGVVLSASGEPLPGAIVIEATHWGNVKVLSRNETDYAGRFWLSNRPPREIILAASADGHGSTSVAALVKHGMKPVTLQLPPQLSLRGRVVNDAGEAIASASVQLADVSNQGLGLIWSDKTDGDGRFVWSAAPTNEVALNIFAPEYSQRIVRLIASTNEHVIVLRRGDSDVVHITGTAVDSRTARPIERFTVKVGHDENSGVPTRITHTIETTNGRFELNTSKSEVAVGNYPYWILAVEADGYDSIATRPYEFEEGDQEFHFQMTPGGVVEGTVRKPDGEPAAGCQLAVVPRHDSVPSSEPGKFSERSGSNPADSQGHFKVEKPVTPGTLIAFHDSGWVTFPVPSNSTGLEIQLRSWAQIDGNLMNGETPIAGETILITRLILWDPAESIAIVRSVTTDTNGHFVFEKLLPGDYQVSVNSPSWQRMNTVNALQTPVTVASGEARHIRLGDSGQTVAAKLRPPRSAAAADWPNTLAILSRDMTLPSQPSRSDFVSSDSHVEAAIRYANDPSVLAAYREVRSYVARIGPDGTATFDNVPAGKYVLEVKTFTPPSPERREFTENARVVAQLRVPVWVPPQTDGCVTIGPFSLETE